MLELITRAYSVNQLDIGHIGWLQISNQRWAHRRCRSLRHNQRFGSRQLVNNDVVTITASKHINIVAARTFERIVVPAASDLVFKFITFKRVGKVGATNALDAIVNITRSIAGIGSRARKRGSHTSGRGFIARCVKTFAANQDIARARIAIARSTHAADQDVIVGTAKQNVRTNATNQTVLAAIAVQYIVCTAAT